MDKEKNIERAKEIFAAHSGKDAVYFASDGQAFFSESDRNNHARILKDKATQTVTREDVMPSEPDAEDNDDDDDDLEDALTQVKDKGKGKGKGKGAITENNAADDKAKTDKAADADDTKANTEGNGADNSASGAASGNPA